MFDLQWLAYQADVTRVTTFMLGRELGGRAYPELGVPVNHHGLSHHQDDPEKIADLAKINPYHVDLFAYFLEKLRSTPEGDGSLLDHVVLLYGGGLGDPNQHSHLNLPLALVGSTPQKRGRHLQYPETPLTNLLLAMLGQGRRPGEPARRQHGTASSSNRFPVSEDRSTDEHDDQRPAMSDHAALAAGRRRRGGRMRTHAVSRWTVLPLAALSFGAAARDVPLVEAVKEGSAESVRALLDRRANVNGAEADGTTALHWAVQGEAAALVGLLIDAGADVSAANRYGVTPLSLACVTGNAGIIATLLEAGADANAATAGGRTALMTAARTEDVAAVEVLLANGADVHATDDTHGQTALMWAAAENNAGVVDTLVRAGADVGARTRHGFTALLFAARAGRIEAAKALLAAGAEVDETEDLIFE